MEYAEYKLPYQTIEAAINGHIIDIEAVITNYSDYINFVVFNEIKKHPGIIFQVEDIKQEIKMRILSGIRNFDSRIINK